MVNQHPGLHSDIEPVNVRPIIVLYQTPNCLRSDKGDLPGTPHRSPLVHTIVKDVVERLPVPKGASDSRVVPEHGPWLGRVVLVPLEQRILRLVVKVPVEQHAVGSRRVLVRANILNRSEKHAATKTRGTTTHPWSP